MQILVSMMKKKRAQKPKYVKICPKCGSVKVGVDFSNPVVWNFGTNVKYQCQSCHHVASIFPEVPLEEIATFQQEFREGIAGSKETRGPRLDASTGYSVALFIIFLKLFIPVLLVLLVGVALLFYLF